MFSKLFQGNQSFMSISKIKGPVLFHSSKRKKKEEKKMGEI